MNKIKNVIIAGGGNIGTYFACVLSSKGFDVTILSSKPDTFSKQINVINESGETIYSSKEIRYTSKIEQAINETDMLFVTYPAFMLYDFSKKIEKYVRTGLYIGVIPGTGGAEFAFRNCVDKGAVLFGIQRVPAVARLVEYGKTVKVEGKRDKLYLSSIPNKHSKKLSEFMASCFDMECDIVPNYLNITMTPSNPILHTTRLYALFKNYSEGMVYKKNPLFYGEWDNESSDILLKCDDEHQNILRNLVNIDTSCVRSLREHYESNSIMKLTSKLSSIQSLHNIYSPMIKVEGGYIPDFKSRYFTADFPYGLAIIKEFAKIAKVDTPNIDLVLNWYYEFTKDISRFNLLDYNINTVDDIVQLYNKK